MPIIPHIPGVFMGLQVELFLETPRINSTTSLLLRVSACHFKNRTEHRNSQHKINIQYLAYLMEECLHTSFPDGLKPSESSHVVKFDVRHLFHIKI